MNKTIISTLILPTVILFALGCHELTVNDGGGTTTVHSGTGSSSSSESSDSGTTDSGAEADTEDSESESESETETAETESESESESDTGDCQAPGEPCHPTSNPNATLFCCSSVCGVGEVCQ